MVLYENISPEYKQYFFSLKKNVESWKSKNHLKNI